MSYKKITPNQCDPAYSDGRGDKIRTCDPIVPNDVRYQTALHLEIKEPRITSGLWLWNRIRTPTNRVRVCRATVTPFLNVYCSLLQAVQSTIYIIYYEVRFVNIFLKFFKTFLEVFNFRLALTCCLLSRNQQ